MIFRRITAAVNLIRAEVMFAPLYKNELSDDERADENEYHLGMHRLMAAVLLMHASVLHSEVS